MLEKEITRLSSIWYDYVSMDHYKDRDCHWTIEKTWSYGKKAKYRVYHFGYIYSCKNVIECDTYVAAEVALLQLLKHAIKLEQEWCLDCIHSKDGCDNHTKKQARFLSGVKV